MNVKRLILLMYAAALLAVSVTGCRNTAEGVGKDMENAGEKIQDKAR